MKKTLAHWILLCILSGLLLLSCDLIGSEPTQLSDSRFNGTFVYTSTFSEAYTFDGTNKVKYTTIRDITHSDWLEFEVSSGKLRYKTWDSASATWTPLVSYRFDTTGKYLTIDGKVFIKTP